MSMEPFIDVLRLDYLDLVSSPSMKAIISEHHPALVIARAKGKHGLREKLLAMGYHSALIAGSSSVKAVRR